MKSQKLKSSERFSARNSPMFLRLFSRTESRRIYAVLFWGSSNLPHLLEFWAPWARVKALREKVCSHLL
jgi:hypothetical protein